MRWAEQELSVPSTVATVFELGLRPRWPGGLVNQDSGEVEELGLPGVRKNPQTSVSQLLMLC